MENYSVYKHTAPNGKVYIGITKRKPEVRWRKNGTGYMSSPHFYAAIKKYGWDNIEHEILADGLTKEQACEEEKRLIYEYRSCDREFGYNNSYGGETGLKITPETRKKISDSNKAFYSNPAVRERLRVAATGYKHTDEARKKISEAKKGKSHKLSETHKQHISKARKKRMESDDQFKNECAVAWANVGRSHAKMVEQLSINGEHIKTYNSLHDAERETGVRNGNISKCCNKIVKSAGGYIWRYAS